MEKPSSENPDHLISDYTSDHDDDQDNHHHHHQRGSGASQSSSARSYECTFCKRGFSNAQALGGHMNIHRKDKAKLKLASSNHETKQRQQQTSEISNNMQIISSSYSSPSPPLIMNPNWFCDKEGRDDHLAKDQKPARIILDDQGQGLELNSSARGPRGSSESEILDLELRLGPEPPPPHQDSSSSPTSATRKFF